MIVRTYNQCAKVCDNDLIWVATDDERIKRTCEKNNIQVLILNNALQAKNFIGQMASLELEREILDV